jgi:hypothetical protein
LAISDLFRRRDEPDAVEAADRSPTFPTKALPKLLATLKAREQPVLLDLGPVVGTNVTFFGEQLGCKIFVEDIFSDIDRHVGAGTVAQLPKFLSARFPQPDGSVDGILCWDVFDYLDKPAAQALAAQLTRILRPDGVVLAFFGTVTPKAGQNVYVKHTVVTDTTLRHREYAAARGKQTPLLNRDIIRMFEPARVTEQFLLKSNLREVLFRKPAA